MRPSAEQAPAPRGEGRFLNIRFFELPASGLARPTRTTGRLPTPTARARQEQGQLEPEAAALVERLLARAGLDRSAYRAGPLERRLAACIRSLRARSTAEALERLALRPGPAGDALDALLIGVTGFFRDAEVFDVLDRHVLPSLASRGGGLSVWSAGCSSGEELYSVALLLARQGRLEGSALLGTDCRDRALDAARAGLYPPDKLEGLDQELRREFFSQERGGLRVAPALRRATRWVCHDVLTGPPEHEEVFDLVLCRNLSIYLSPDAASVLWSVLVSALRPGGALVTGKSERPERRSELARLGPCVFVKRG